MSRKDYRAFAEILATSQTVEQVRERLAHYLRCDNPRIPTATGHPLTANPPANTPLFSLLMPPRS